MQDLYAPTRWTALLSLFRSTFLTLHSLPSLPLLHLSLQAGLASLKTHVCCPLPGAKATDAATASCPICASPLKELAKEVPYSHHTNTTIVCGISGLVVEGEGDGGQLLALVSRQKPSEGNVYSKEVSLAAPLIKVAADEARRCSKLRRSTTMVESWTHGRGRPLAGTRCARCSRSEMCRVLFACNPLCTTRPHSEVQSNGFRSTMSTRSPLSKRPLTVSLTTSATTPGAVGALHSRHLKRIHVAAEILKAAKICAGDVLVLRSMLGVDSLEQLSLEDPVEVRRLHFSDHAECSV